eukprot:11443943-Prorocentrum_lima.AAC.1
MVQRVVEGALQSISPATMTVGDSSEAIYLAGVESLRIISSGSMDEARALARNICGFEKAN